MKEDKTDRCDECDGECEDIHVQAYSVDISVILKAIPGVWEDTLFIGRVNFEATDDEDSEREVKCMLWNIMNDSALTDVKYSVSEGHVEHTIVDCFHIFDEPDYLNGEE